MSAWKNFEREVARVLKKIGFETKRLWRVQFEEGGEIDVEAKKKDLKFDIQCKYTSDKKNLSHFLRTSWEKANNAKRGDNIPVGMTRVRRSGTWVVIGYHDFLNLLKWQKS